MRRFENKHLRPKKKKKKIVLFSLGQENRKHTSQCDVPFLQNVKTHCPMQNEY